MYVEHVGQFKGLFVQYTQKDAILYFEVGHTLIHPNSNFNSKEATIQRVYSNCSLNRTLKSK